MPACLPAEGPKPNHIAQLYCTGKFYFKTVPGDIGHAGLPCHSARPNGGSMTAPRCWILTEGHIGMVNQALGLAEAMGLAPEVKRLAIRAPWRHLPPRLWLGALEAAGPAGDRLAQPWPDLVISCGKRSAVPALAVKRASGGRSFAVHIQTPPVPAGRFDLVVAPAHDGLAGPNVLVTRAAVHRVTPAKLAEAAARFAPSLAALPRPLVAVLIGGSNGRHRLTPDVMARVADQLAALARDRGIGLAVTPSRRTGADNEAILRDRLRGLAAVIWDGAGDNPYFGYLGLADAVVVTADSVSMASEAVSTGKPVYVVDLPGASRRLDRFQATLRDAGMTRRFAGAIERWHYAPPDDTARAAAEIWRRIDRREAAD
jgi:mitochondrial fission protein ELM1